MALAADSRVMPRASFTLAFPEGVWIGDLTREYPGVTVRVLSAFPTDERGYALVEVMGDDAPAVVDRMAVSSSVIDLDVIQTGGDSVIAQFETTDLPLLVTIQRSQIPLELPIEIRDGRVSLTIVTSHERVSRFGDQLRGLNIDHRLERIRPSFEDDLPLTDHQRDLLLAALDHGYYDTPRETTLTDLAETLGMAPSTLSETLHRAEERVVKTFATDYLGRDAEP